MPSTSINENKLATEPFYKPFGRLMKEWFGRPAYKLTIDAGFTCPNIDGSRATGGCTFCDNTSFSPTLRTGLSQVTSQIERGKKFYRERFDAVHFLAYFQTFTNTYAPVDKLKTLYDEALSVPDIVGMAIGTRPDCIDAEKLKLIQSYAAGEAEPWVKRREAGETATDKPFICIEYGMQTMHDEIGDSVNRAHNHAETVEAVRLTREYAPDVHLCLHLINGLHGESKEMIHQTINECARLRPDSVKFHHCYVYENTRMAEQYAAGEFEVLTLEEHVNLAADCIERMPPETCMQRLVGEVSDSGVIAPLWGKKKMQIYQMVTDELRRRGTHQSVKFQG
ncbi:MAG: TIGR01212 family radical SAM protein [Planctomycetes bacterium]|nr:TIGR01212 family radical SAM protein [Planctomycetota bacterium]